MRTLMLATALVFGTLARAQTFTVKARLVDQAGIPKRLAEKAEAETTYLARTAGISLVWVDSNGSPDLVFFVVKGCDCGAKKATLGQTLVGEPHTSTYAYIYFNHVLTAAHNTDLSPGDLLGDAIAHEVGHLLGLRHVRDGIMTATWTGRQLTLLAQRWMRFNPAEALEMQTEIRVRGRLQHEESALAEAAAQICSLQ